MVWRTVQHMISSLINYTSWVDMMLQWFYHLYSMKCYNSITSNTEKMQQNGDVIIIPLCILTVHRVWGSPSAWPMLTKNLSTEKGTDSRSCDEKSRLHAKLEAFWSVWLAHLCMQKKWKEQEGKTYHWCMLKGLSYDKSHCGYYGREIFGGYLCHAIVTWVILSTNSRKLHQAKKFARKNACNVLLECIFPFRQTSYFEINKVYFNVKD